MKKNLAIICLTCFLYACDNGNTYDIKTEDKYEKGKLTLEQIEQKTPVKFLKATASSKKNLLQQTVIRGKIQNSAKIVSFKDISIRLSFYSKTGALLEQDEEQIFENINPGGTASFKSKYFAPKGTDSIAVTVLGAKF